MKKTLLVIALVGLGFSLIAQSTVPTGVMPATVQPAFYTPAYQCIYMKGADEIAQVFKPNTWCAYTAAIAKANVGYDGMGGVLKEFNAIRIKANTEKAGQAVVMYLDNIAVKDAKGKLIMKLDFENGDPAGPYVSQGKPMDKNGTVVEYNGKKVFMLQMKTETLYGYSGIEVQWMLPANAGSKTKNWDFSSGEYVVTFDYLVAVAP